MPGAYATAPRHIYIASLRDPPLAPSLPRSLAPFPPSPRAVPSLPASSPTRTPQATAAREQARSPPIAHRRREARRAFITRSHSRADFTEGPECRHRPASRKPQSWLRRRVGDRPSPRPAPLSRPAPVRPEAARPETARSKAARVCSPPGGRPAAAHPAAAQLAANPPAAASPGSSPPRRFTRRESGSRTA